MTLCGFSQNTTMTQGQIDFLIHIATPEKVIGWSKCITNEQAQSIKIDTLNKRLVRVKELTRKALLQNERFTAQMDSISTDNELKQALVNDAYLNQINVLKRQIRKEKFKGLKIGGIGLATIIGIILIK